MQRNRLTGAAISKIAALDFAIFSRKTGDKLTFSFRNFSCDFTFTYYTDNVAGNRKV
jgi:hypothetical protein